jgi:hypothetical protein
MAPRMLHDGGGSQPSYGSKETSARTRQPRQLSFRQAPALLRQPRHHTNRVPKPLWLPRRHVLRALAPLCWTLLTPIKGRSRALLQRVGRTGKDGTALAPAWTLVTPYCKRTRPGRGTNTKAVGFPFYACLPPAFSPLRAPSRADPSGLGHAATIYSLVQGPPGVEMPTVSKVPR